MWKLGLGLVGNSLDGKLLVGMSLVGMSLGACAQKESRMDSALGSNAPQPGAIGRPVGASTPGSGAGANTGSVDDRLARLERRMDRVVALLEQNLPPQAPTTDAIYAVPVEAVDPVRGPADAKVTVVEVFEFACPTCQSLSSVLDGALAKWPADVRVVAKYLPMRGTASVMPGLVACAAAKQGKYEPVRAALWKIDGANVGAVKQAAIAAGADGTKLEADLVACQAWLQNSQAMLRGLGVTATPTLFVNGRVAEGAQTQPIVEAMITEALGKANDAIAAGVAQNAYYNSEIVGKGAKTVKSRFDD